MSSTQFNITKLQHENSTKLLEVLVVFIASFLGIALLPQILVRYVYANQPLLETPVLLEAIPVVLFAFSVAYLVYALVGNYLRYSRIRLMEKDLMMDASCECGGNCECHGHDDMKDLEELVKEVEAAMPETATLSQAMKKSSKSRTTATKKKPARKKSSK